MLEHDKLDSLLNRIDWDQPLSPLDLNLPTDPDVITLLTSSSSSISPVVLPNQPPNPLVDNFILALTDNPIQFTDNPTVSQQESQVTILLRSLFDSQTDPNNDQSKESQSTPFSPTRQSSNSIAVKTSTQDARASPLRPNKF